MIRQVIRGITWNHSRALPPLVATAQRFEEIFPSIHIQWEKRTLHEFGHMGLAELAGAFDLLIVDHPMMGDAHASGMLLDLMPMLPQRTIDEMRADALGASFESYFYKGSLYALPVDAAAPAASFRPDLLAAAGFEPPRTWEDLLCLAQQGLVVMPGFPADLFLNFMGLYVSLGGEISNEGQLTDHETELQAIDLLKQLSSAISAEIGEMNPIALYERMAGESTAAYCPFAYTYSNYSRDGFARHLLEFVSPVTLRGRPIRTVLGGTGIAISSRCSIPDVALQYCLLTAGDTWQRTLYGACGGQPARRSAWQDSTLNALTHNFFQKTQASIETAYVRPRYPGYTGFQESAGIPLAHCLCGKTSPTEALSQMHRLQEQTTKG